MKAQLEDKRTQGDKLNAAEATLRKAKANHEKRETALKEAQEAMDEAELELAEAAAILKQVKADLAPETPETQQTDEVLRLGAGDVRELLKLLKQQRGCKCAHVIIYLIYKPGLYRNLCFVTWGAFLLQFSSDNFRKSTRSASTS